MLLHLALLVLSLACCCVVGCAVLCCAVLCCVVLCCVVLCCVVLCCVVLCCVVLCCVVLGWIAVFAVSRGRGVGVSAGTLQDVMDALILTEFEAFHVLHSMLGTYNHTSLCHELLPLYGSDECVRVVCGVVWCDVM